MRPVVSPRGSVGGCVVLSMSFVVVMVVFRWYVFVVLDLGVRREGIVASDIFRCRGCYGTRVR